MAAVIKHVQRVFQRQTESCMKNVCSKRSFFDWYNKSEGVPRDILVWMQKDYDFSIKGIKRMIKEGRYENLKDSQRYIRERHKILGPDLATSHFIVKRGGAVKFVGRDTWFRMDENQKYYLPNRQVDGMLLEAVDASNTQLMYIGFDNFIDLEHLRYLNLSNCEYINDWCMSRIGMLQPTLEFLDISGCQQVTDDGLACLHHLENLKALKISNLPSVKHSQLMALLLEEALPKCQVFGVDFSERERDSEIKSDSEEHLQSVQSKADNRR